MEGSVLGSRSSRPLGMTSVLSGHLKTTLEEEEDVARNELPHVRTNVPEHARDACRGKGDREHEAVQARHRANSINLVDDGRKLWAAGYIVNRIYVSKQLWMSARRRMAQHGGRSMVRRSIFGLPMLPPYHMSALAWMGFMLLFDLIYTVRERVWRSAIPLLPPMPDTPHTHAYACTCTQWIAGVESSYA